MLRTAAPPLLLRRTSAAPSALTRTFSSSFPLLAKPSFSSSKSKRHHPHHAPPRTAAPHAHGPTPRGAPLNPPAPRSAPLPGSHAAAAGPTGFVTASAASTSPASWWSAQPRSTRASLLALGVSGYVIVAWVVYQALADKDKDKDSSTDVPEKQVGESNADRETSTTPPLRVPASTCQADHKHVYDDLASSYDWSIGWDELVMGLLLVRRWVISHAKGDTLELAAGTGRNLPYYRAPPQVTSLTLTDTSVAMLDQAVRTHLTKTSREGQPLTLATTRRAIPTRVLPADAHVLPFASHAFDTVVSTFSLCSLHDPVGALGEALRVLKPGGSLWLVEHGRGKYAWMNKGLDKNAERHAAKWGCWYNRDIGGIVDAAIAGEKGVRVERMYRLHFGTTWIVEVVRE